jgi:hypothetical protein
MERDPLLLLLAAALLASAVPAGATHGEDGTYDQPLFEGWTPFRSGHLDVLILPPRTPAFAGPPLAPEPTTYKFVAEAVRDWDEAVDAFGPGWLAENLTLHPLDGADDVEPHLLRDPDIVVGPGGVAGQTSRCTVPEYYVDDVPTCDGDEELYCYAGYAAAPPATYSTAAHEIGHCLGISHAPHPAQDVMDDPYPTKVCPSSLNVAGIEAAWAAQLNPSASPTNEIPVDQYAQTDCWSGS